MSARQVLQMIAEEGDPPQAALDNPMRRPFHTLLLAFVGTCSTSVLARHRRASLCTSDMTLDAAMEDESCAGLGDFSNRPEIVGDMVGDCVLNCELQLDGMRPE